MKTLYVKQWAIIKVTSIIAWGPGHKSATRAKTKVKRIRWPTVTTRSRQRKRERDQTKLWRQSTAHEMMRPRWQPRAGQEQDDELLSIHKCPTRIVNRYNRYKDLQSLGRGQNALRLAPEGLTMAEIRPRMQWRHEHKHCSKDIEESIGQQAYSPQTTKFVVGRHVIAGPNDLWQLALRVMSIPRKW